jgi:hypothetical protein
MPEISVCWKEFAERFSLPEHREGWGGSQYTIAEVFKLLFPFQVGVVTF